MCYGIYIICSLLYYYCYLKIKKNKNQICKCEKKITIDNSKKHKNALFHKKLFST